MGNLSVTLLVICIETNFSSAYMTIYTKNTSIYEGKCRRLFQNNLHSTFNIANYYHFVKGEKEEDFINKKGFWIPAVEFLKNRVLNK